MTSITSWHRVEPRVRGRSLGGVEARVYDPLWQLGRQWQLGEFRGEDAGSPIAAKLTASVGRLSRFAPDLPTAATSVGAPYDPAAVPLEVLVESESALASDELNLRLAAEAGLAFLRELDAQRASHLRKNVLLTYPIPRYGGLAREEMDGAALRLVDVLSGRVPNGIALREAIEDARAAGKRLPEQPQLSDLRDQQRLAAAIDAWLGWWSGLDAAAAGAEPAAWNGRRLEYSFAVSGRVGTGEHTLVAPDYDGRHLDWDAFDYQPRVSLGAGSDTAPWKLEQTTMPTPISYAGMPRARWWEFEDSDVHFGAVEAGREDLTRLLLMEFALIYGNDFFLIPLPLPVGALCRIIGIEVTDTFGGRWTIPSVRQVDGAGGEFRLFEAAPARGARVRGGAPVLLLAPATIGALSGRAVEEVALLRDEMANMAWAVERTVVGAAGGPLSRHEAFHDRRQRKFEADGSAVPSQSAMLRYRIANRPPDHWLPLVPVQETPNRNVLQVRSMLDEEQNPLLPKGRLIKPGQLIEDEEVTREGVQVSRSWQHTRWLGGRAFLWSGRRATIGRGEASSGLRFDIAEPKT